MRQWSYKYRNLKELKIFVDRENLARYDQILIQINCGVYDKRAIEKMLQDIREVIPHAVIAGISSIMQLCHGVPVKERIVLGITAFEKSRIAIFKYRFSQTCANDYESAAKELFKRIEKDTKGILMLTNAIYSDMEAFFETCNRYFSHIPLFGGIASDEDERKRFYLFDREEIMEGEGFVAVFLHGEDLIITCDHFFDWVPIGRRLTVTKADGRYLYELDHQKVVDVYAKYFEPVDKFSLPQYALAHPLIRQIDADEPIARAILDIEEDRVLFSGEFIEGEKVQIGFGHYRRMMKRYKKVHEVYAKLPAEALWFYICISYTYGYLDILKASGSLFEESEKLFAMATYGEFTHTPSGNRFMNFTLSKVVLSERPDARIKIVRKKIHIDERDRLLATLSTLVDTSSREIAELNQYLEKEVARRTKELAELNKVLEKRIKIEVKKNREKDKMLYHQSKLAAMGEMINNIAHQWRQPLNIIALMMQDLSLKAQMGHLNAADVLNAEKRIHETLKYLSDTIDDFRSFTADEFNYGERGSMHLIETVKDSIRLIHVALEDKKIALKTSFPSEDITVVGNGNDLKQVLMNLIYNAIDALEEKGVEEPLIRVSVKYDDRKAFVVVKDNGGGIDEKIIDKIFEPYFTTKYMARGTGLGLYMSKMIVENRLKGKIDVRNTRQGAAFWLELPLKA